MKRRRYRRRYRYVWHGLEENSCSKVNVENDNDRSERSNRNSGQCSFKPDEIGLIHDQNESRQITEKSRDREQGGCTKREY